MTRSWRNQPRADDGTTDYQCGICEQHWEFPEEAIDCCTREFHDRDADLHIHELLFSDRLELAMRCSQLDTNVFWDAVSEIADAIRDAGQ